MRGRSVYFFLALNMIAILLVQGAAPTVATENLHDRVLRFGVGDNFYSINGVVQEVVFRDWMRPENTVTYLDPCHNRVMVNVDVLSVAFAATTIWNGGRHVTLVYNDIVLMLQRELPLPNNMGMATNESNPQGLWFIPLRYVAYAFGAEVVWDEENQAVYVFDFWE